MAAKAIMMVIVEVMRRVSLRLRDGQVGAVFEVAEQFLKLLAESE